MSAQLNNKIAALTEDLQTMTRHYQDSQRVIDDNDNLKIELENRITEYAQAIQQYENQLAEYENEKKNLISSLSQVTDERHELNSAIQNSLSGQSSLQSELNETNNEKDRLHFLVQQQQNEIQQTTHSLNLYEQQLNEVTSALTQMDMLIRQSEEEKKALMEDLNSSRAFCYSLETSKDKQNRQLASSTLEAQQIKNQLTDVNGENGLLRKQLSEAEIKVREFESFINQSRQKELLTNQISHQRLPPHAPLIPTRRGHAHANEPHISPNEYRQTAPVDNDTELDVYRVEAHSMAEESAKLVQKLSEN